MYFSYNLSLCLSFQNTSVFQKILVLNNLVIYIKLFLKKADWNGRTVPVPHGIQRSSEAIRDVVTVDNPLGQIRWKCFRSLRRQRSLEKVHKRVCRQTYSQTERKTKRRTGRQEDKQLCRKIKGEITNRHI